MNQDISEGKFKKFEKLCGCKKYPITKIFRNWIFFISTQLLIFFKFKLNQLVFYLVCRISDKHKTHLNIHLDMFNLKKNILSYANLLQKDIMGTLELNKNIRYNSFDENINYK